MYILAKFDICTIEGYINCPARVVGKPPPTSHIVMKAPIKGYTIGSVTVYSDAGIKLTDAKLSASNYAGSSFIFSPIPTGKHHFGVVKFFEGCAEKSFSDLCVMALTEGIILDGKCRDIVIATKNEMALAHKCLAAKWFSEKMTVGITAAQEPVIIDKHHRMFLGTEQQPWVGYQLLIRILEPRVTTTGIISAVSRATAAA